MIICSSVFHIHNWKFYAQSMALLFKLVWLKLNTFIIIRIFNPHTLSSHLNSIFSSQNVNLISYSSILFVMTFTSFHIFATQQNVFESESCNTISHLQVSLMLPCGLLAALTSPTTHLLTCAAPPRVSCRASIMASGEAVVPLLEGFL